MYSEGFRRDVLIANDREEPPAIAVRALTRDTITLEAAMPRQDIGHPGTVGLYWDGGYSQVHEVLDVRDGRVTRRFTHLKDGLPPVCPDAPLESCEKVSLGGYAFPDDPSDVGLPFEETTYQSPLGPMGAWTVPAPGSQRWSLHVHGWTAHRREAIRMLRSVHAAGWNSMVINYRNDEGSPRDPSGFFRFGLSEWEDVEAAVQHLAGLGASDVVLVGYSTGAAHSMAFLERSELADSVVGLVFDSPNIDMTSATRHGSRGARFPIVGLPITRLMIELGMWIADVRWKVDWEGISYLFRAKDTIKVPTLLFHGTADKRVPVSVGRSLARRLGPLIAYIETPAAGHVMSWNADPERYENELTGFLRGL